MNMSRLLEAKKDLNTQHEVDHVNDEVTQPGYFKEAKTWYQENYEVVTASRNRYRLMCGAFGLLLALAVTAIIIIMPLKAYIYRIIEVNKQTGEMTILKEMEGKTFSSTFVINRYFINQYVQNRESYSMEDIKRKFNLVLAMSAKPIADEYLANTVSTNPKSPIKLLGNEFYREVRVMSINQLNPNTALVRYQTLTHNKNNLAETKTDDWETVVKWEYVNPSESLEERDKNPLGFSVIYYQNSPVFSEK